MKKIYKTVLVAICAVALLIASGLMASAADVKTVIVRQLLLNKDICSPRRSSWVRMKITATDFSSAPLVCDYQNE